MSDPVPAIQSPDQHLPAATSNGTLAGVFNFADFDQAWTAAQVVANSQIAPKDYQGCPENVISAWQYGSELGLPPMQSLTAMAVINGRPSLYGDGFLAVIKSSREFAGCFEEFDDDSQTATCTMKRHGQPDVTRTFSANDAEKAGLWDKAGPWKQYPKRMMQMRARGFAGRDQWADVLRGMAIAEEVYDTPTERDVTPAPTEAPALPSGKAESIMDKLQRSNADSTVRAHADESAGGPADDQPSLDLKVDPETGEIQRTDEQLSQSLPEAERSNDVTTDADRVRRFENAIAHIANAKKVATLERASEELNASGGKNYTPSQIKALRTAIAENKKRLQGGR